MEEFVHFPLRFGTCAVYVLLCKGRVVYVGQSTNVFARIATHYQSMRRKQRGLHVYLNVGDRIRTSGVVFDEVRVKPCRKDHLDKEELELIQKHLPQHNVQHKRPRPKFDLTLLPGFEQMLVSGRREAKIKRRKLSPNPVQVTRVRGVTLPKLKCLESNAA